MKFTEDQKNLIALVPTHEIIKSLTDSAKLVLGNIILLYGMDKAVENGYVFRDNLTMANETGITEKTVIASVRKLVQVGLITTKRGKRKSASEYYLTDKYYEISGEEKPNYSKTIENYSKTNDLMQIIDDMQQQIIDLQRQIDELKSTVKSTVKGENYSKTIENYSNEDTNYSTETETESEIEKDEIIHESILHETEQSLADEYDEIFNEVDYDEVERVQAAYLQDPNPSSVSFKERNEWATRCYEELEANIQVLFKCWDVDMILNYSDKINSIFDKVDERINQGWFTEKQIAKFDAITNNFNAIIRKKAELIEQHDSSVQVTEQSPGSNENNITSIESKNNMVEPPVLECEGKQYYFSENVITYMMTLFETGYMGHRRIDDWYKGDIDTLNVAINNLEDVTYRDYYINFMKEEGFYEPLTSLNSANNKNA